MRLVRRDLGVASATVLAAATVAGGVAWAFHSPSLARRQQRLRFPWPDGRFRLIVPAGRYAVELLADGPRIHDFLVQTIGVTVRAGQRANAIFRFDVP